jgi:allantoinase
MRAADPRRVVARAVWQHVLAGDIDLVASDHSPCTADLKARG